jgi:hypothetical protein
MRRHRSLVLGSAVAVAVAAVGAAGLSGPASATGTVAKQDLTLTPSGEVLFLDLTEPDQVYLEQDESTTTQDAFDTRCGVTIAGDLLTITAIGSDGGSGVKLGNDGERIGVGERQDGGNGCYTADLEFPGQGLRLDFGDRLVAGMDLDISFKGESGLSAQGYYVEKDENGSSVAAPIEVLVEGGPEDVTDDGPDCAGCDHYRVQLTPAGPINQLVLKPKAIPTSNPSTASISLSGGWTDIEDVVLGQTTISTSASVFQIVSGDAISGILKCDETQTVAGVTITHLPVNGDGEPCEFARPFYIEQFSEAGNGGTNPDNFLISLLNSVADAYVVRVPFDVPEPVSYVDGLPGSEGVKWQANDFVVEVDYLTDPQTVRSLELCSGTYPAEDTGNGIYSGLSMPFDVLPDDAIYPGDQGVCGIERTFALDTGYDGNNTDTEGNGIDTVKVIETLYIVGDPLPYKR